MDLPPLADQQCGVLSHAQLIEAGWTTAEIRRALRRQHLVRVQRGVYVTHTGPLMWLERAWIGILGNQPAALAGRSALRMAARATVTRRDGEPVELLVAEGRRLNGGVDVVIHRASHWQDRVQTNLLPPRERIEHAVLSLAASATTDLDAVAVLADACGARLTTPARLSAALTARPKLTRRRWLAPVVADLAAGTHSVLEHGYLTLVERPHGLPRAQRQASGPGRTWQDVRYDGYGLVVELDGVAHHTGARDRARDLDRDLTVAAERTHETVRIGYTQVFDTGCRTAVQVASILNRRGWSGAATACTACG